MRRDNIQVAFFRSQIGLTSRSIGACHARTPSILVSSSIELLMGPLLRSGKGRFDVWALLTTDADVDGRRQEHNFAPKQEGPPAAKQRRLLQPPPIDKSNNLPQSYMVYVHDREALAAAALRRIRKMTPTSTVSWSREPNATAVTQDVATSCLPSVPASHADMVPGTPACPRPLPIFTSKSSNLHRANPYQLHRNAFYAAGLRRTMARRRSPRGGRRRFLVYAHWIFGHRARKSSAMYRKR